MHVRNREMMEAVKAYRLKLTTLFLQPTGIKTYHFDALNKSLARAVTIGP